MLEAFIAFFNQCISLLKKSAAVAFGLGIWFCLLSYHPEALTSSLQHKVSAGVSTQQATESTPNWGLSAQSPAEPESVLQRVLAFLFTKEPSRQELLPSKTSQGLAPVPMAPVPLSASESQWKSNTSEFAVVPMSNQPKALFVKAFVNNNSLGHFVLDTGATYMSISRDMAEELHLDLKHSAHVPITTANGTIEVPKVVLKSVKVNGLEARNIEATVMDFKTSSNFSGLLGLSFINRFRLTLDPAKGQMTFEPVQGIQTANAS